MLDLQLDITDLEDLKSTRNAFMQEQFRVLAVAHLIAGNRVIIKRAYTNAPPDLYRVFSSPSDFENFWRHLYS